MFQVGKISSNLYGLVGLRQPFNPSYSILDADNQISRSGYYVTDNAYVKLEYLKDTQDYKNITEADFNIYLKRLQQSSILNVCHRVFNRFDYLDRNLLYINAQNKVNQELLIDGFVGYKIQVSSDLDIAFKIKRVLLDFDTTGLFKLMLFNTSKSDPILEQDITITSKTQELALNWVVDNSDVTYKGDYYLGYIKTATTPIPFKRDYMNSDIMTNISHLSIDKRQVKGHLIENLFDLIINNDNLFARAINLEFSISVLREQLNSLRINSNERNAEKQTLRILAEIEGTDGESSLKLTGLSPLLIGEISQITKEINRLKVGYFNDSIKVTTIC